MTRTTRVRQFSVTQASNAQRPPSDVCPTQYLGCGSSDALRLPRAQRLRGHSDNLSRSGRPRSCVSRITALGKTVSNDPGSPSAATALNPLRLNASGWARRSPVTRTSLGTTVKWSFGLPIHSGRRRPFIINGRISWARQFPVTRITRVRKSSVIRITHAQRA